MLELFTLLLVVLRSALRGREDAVVENLWGCRRAKSRTGVGARRDDANRRRASGACRRCEAVGGADTRPGEGGQRLPPQEVRRQEVPPPAHHPAEPREQEAEGVGVQNLADNQAARS